jgi:hypothetical protein
MNSSTPHWQTQAHYRRRTRPHHAGKPSSQTLAGCRGCNRIDVWTALNIQHLESRPTPVAHYHVVVRNCAGSVIQTQRMSSSSIYAGRTHPKIEGRQGLSPDRLRARGIYARQSHRFARTGLRSTADRVNQMVDYLRQNASGPMGDVGRLLVCVGAGSSSDVLCRRRARDRP